MDLKVSDPEMARLANTIVRSSAELADIAEECASLIEGFNQSGVQSGRVELATAYLGPSVRRAASRLSAAVSPLVSMTNHYIDGLDNADADFDAEV